MSRVAASSTVLSALDSMTARIFLLAAALLCAAAPLAAQSTPANPEFDVATIKASNPNQPGKQFMAKGHEFVTINTTLDDLITFAYGIHTRQIAGGPAWIATDKFDLDGKSSGADQPTDAQWKRMIQKLLQDRFQLTYHREPRELSVYMLTVTRGGPKMKPSEADPNSLPGSGFRGFGNMPVFNATMADFAGMMQGLVLDRPMIDRTGLTGRYDFTLRWTPDDSQFIGMRPPGMSMPGSDSPNAPPTLYTAIEEQLGLKLEATKAPVDVLVIDRVMKNHPQISREPTAHITYDQAATISIVRIPLATAGCCFHSPSDRLSRAAAQPSPHRTITSSRRASCSSQGANLRSPGV